jgi:hypothetical protein
MKVKRMPYELPLQKIHQVQALSSIDNSSTNSSKQKIAGALMLQ